MRNYNPPFKLILATFFAAGAFAAAWGSPSHPGPQDQSRFIGLKNFSDFVVAKNEKGTETTMSSGAIKAPISWNELSVPRNAVTTAGTWLRVEARGIYPDHDAK